MNTAVSVRVTSSVKTDEVIFALLEGAVSELKAIKPDIEVTLINRGKKTIKQLFMESSTPLIVISHQCPILYFSATEKIQYHENTMAFKLKRFEKYGEIPPLIELITNGEHKEIVDATFGMGNDLMLMVQMLPESHFTAYEQHPLIYFVIKEGIMQHYSKDVTARIQFKCASVEKEDLISADVIYADPMFDETVDQHSGIQVLHQYISSESSVLMDHIVKYSKRVVLKAHFRSRLFARYGFDVNVRKSSKSHFGMLHIKR